MEQKIIFSTVEDLIPGIKPDPETAKLSAEERESDIDNGYIRTGQSFDETFLDLILASINVNKYQTFFTDFVRGNREKVKGQIIVDLGAGNTNLGYCLSLLLGAAKYVAIEKYNITATRLREQLSQIKMAEGKLSLEKPAIYDGRKILNDQKIVPINDLMPTSVVQDKMLHFLKRLPDNSVSILTSGIHHFLIDNTEYRDAIAREIERVLSPTGAYISIHSDINTKNLTNIPNLSNNELEIKVYIKALK